MYRDIEKGYNLGYIWMGREKIETSVVSLSVRLFVPLLSPQEAGLGPESASVPLFDELLLVLVIGFWVSLKVNLLCPFRQHIA